MRCLLNLSGNFSLFFLFSLILSCNKEQNSKDIGREIINKNINYFISNLYHSPYKSVNKHKYPVFVLSKVGTSNFFIENCESIDEIEGLNVIENCKQDYFDLINDNGFKIDEHTKYISFEIKELSDEILAKKVKLENIIAKNRKRPYVELIFTNFYIDPKKEKAFILVKENNINKERKKEMRAKQMSIFLSGVRVNGLV